MYANSKNQAVRVKVKKCESGITKPEFRRFSVDPQITSLEVLYSILAKAFEIKTDFGISYRIDRSTESSDLMILLSDWDLDAAFLRAHNYAVANNCEPCLNLKIDVKAFSETQEWDSNSSSNIPSISSALNLQQSIGAGQKYVQNKLPGLIMNQMEKTLSLVTNRLVSALIEDPSLTQIIRPPLTDGEFRYYCDSVGQIIHQRELRKVIYFGGIDPSLRRVVWKHILNVYPAGFTGKERMDYIKRKSTEYTNMRDIWRSAVQGGNIQGELAFVTNMVRKDVLRTDRLHPFYAGSDDNQNIGALFNLLTTYALNHPKVSYCQGMSDLASPLLVTMVDEAQAYICFCAIMNRMEANFMLDGIAMTKKFAHLSEGLQYYDLEFYNYLKMQQADDLLFCYRWLLLELKREFAFEDSMRMLEVSWSSLPPKYPKTEISLFDKEFKPVEIETPSPKSPSKILRAENPYTKICALRRQNSAVNISNTFIVDQSEKLNVAKRLNHSLDDSSIEREPKSLVSKSFKTHQSLDETKIRLLKQNTVPEEYDDKSPNLGNEAINESVNGTVSPEVEFLDMMEIPEKNPFLSSDESPASPEKSLDQQNSLITLALITKKSSGGSHFSELKERIAAGKKGILSTLEKIENDYDPLAATTDVKPKLVKSFNEFLNLTSISKNRLTSELSVENKSATVNNPKFTVTSAGVDSRVNSVDSIETPLMRRLVDESSPDDSQDYFPMTTSMTRELKLEMENLDRQVFGGSYPIPLVRTDTPESVDSIKSPFLKNISNIGYYQLSNQASSSIDPIEPDNLLDEQNEITFKVKMRNKMVENDNNLNRISSCSNNNEVFTWQNPLNQFGSTEFNHSNLQINENTSSIQNSATTPDEQADIEFDAPGEIIEMSQGKKSVTPIRLLRKTESDSTIENICATKKLSALLVESSSSDEESNKKSKIKLNFNNPFYDQIQEMNRKMDDSAISNAFGESILVEQTNLESDKEFVNHEITELPPPSEFGGGNPFLMFLCLTLLLQHRDYIMKMNMDYNELAMHFDKMVRKHNVTRVLNQARRMYQDYLKSHNEKLWNAKKSNVNN